MMLRTSKLIWGAGAALWCAQGCMTLDGLKMKEADASSETEKPGEVIEVDEHPGPDVADADEIPIEEEAGGEPELDSGVVLVDAEPLRDARPPGLDASRDSDVPPPDTGVYDVWVAPPDVIIEPIEPPSVSCSGNESCKADEFCGPSAMCLPTCDAAGACVVFQGTRLIVAVYTHEGTLYVMLAPTVDGAGNPRLDGELWEVVPRGESRLVTNRIGAAQWWSSTSVFLKDGYAYYRRGKNLNRVSLQPGSSEQVLYTLPGNATTAHWVVGETFLAVSTNEGIAFGSLDGQVALRRIVDALPTHPNYPAVLQAEGNRLYFAYTEVETPESVARFYSIQMVEPYAFDELKALRGQNDALWGTVSGQFYYYWTLPSGSMKRVDITDGTVYNVGVGVYPPDWLIGEGRPTLLGDWVYTHQNWGSSNVEAPSQVYLGRCSTLSLGTCQAVVSPRDARSTGIGSVLGVAGEKLYSASGSLLYELPLPPDPCAADLPCTTGKSCGSDKLCH